VKDSKIGKREVKEQVIPTDFCAPKMCAYAWAHIPKIGLFIMYIRLLHMLIGAKIAYALTKVARHILRKLTAQMVVDSRPGAAC
jgi:hypothetical protein